jgi:hypothetical protein
LVCTSSTIWKTTKKRAALLGVNGAELLRLASVERLVPSDHRKCAKRIAMMVARVRTNSFFGCGVESSTIWEPGPYWDDGVATIRPNPDMRARVEGAPIRQRHHSEMCALWRSEA